MRYVLASLHTSASRLLSTAPATTDIYTLSLHDALPISYPRARPGWSSSGEWHTCPCAAPCRAAARRSGCRERSCGWFRTRSEEHTSELQSLRHLVCRLLLEKKKYI